MELGEVDSLYMFLLFWTPDTSPPRTLAWTYLVRILSRSDPVLLPTRLRLENSSRHPAIPSCPLPLWRLHTLSTTPPLLSIHFRTIKVAD